MNISALSNRINFSSNMPIYHVYSDNKSGERIEITDVAGVAKALVRRLNNPSTDEAEFMRSQESYMKDYKAKGISTSTHNGRGSNRHFYILYGKDAETANQLRLDCYRKGNISADQVFSNIFRWLIRPEAKKVRLEDTQEEVGLVLYTIPKGEKYNQLKGFEITTKSGRVIDAFPQKKYDEEAEMAEAIEEYYREKEELTRKKPDLRVDTVKTEKKEKPEQLELFDTSAFAEKEDYVTRRANLPSFPIRSKRRIRG